METSTAVRKLFENYTVVFDTLDFKKQAEYFADTFIMAGPKGAVSQSKADFLEKAEVAVSYYKKLGMSSIKMMSLKEDPIGPDYVNATIHWGAKFEKTGDHVEEFDISYIVHTSLPEPEIILVIAHSDEEETIKRLGLLKEE